jgi:hypothetical protein
VLFRPGFLPKEYVKGRRASYLNPVRMYIFTSAIFFLLFFTFFTREAGELVTNITLNKKTPEQILAMDSVSFATFTARLNKEDGRDSVPMTRPQFVKYVDSIKENVGVRFSRSQYKSKEEYDSLLKHGIKKHNWIQRQLTYKEIAINKKYGNDQQRILNALKETFLHSLPQMLFVSLPLVALLLKLLYIRRRKEFYYISHLIFSGYLYIFMFLLLLIIFGLNRLNDALHWGLISFLSTVMIISIFVYEYLALKNFYRQGWGRTLLKFVVLNIMFAILLPILFIIFAALSLFKI